MERDKLTILTGDWIDGLRTLPDESVQCCVTSPPYWGLRDYQTAIWVDESGKQKAWNCDHVRNKIGVTGNGIDGGIFQSREIYKDICGKCGAKRIDAQIGLEKTPEEYVAKLVAGFRELRRVLRSDGTLWLNLGDSYFGSWGNYSGENRGKGYQRRIINGSLVPNPAWNGREKCRPGTAFKHAELKPKDLVGIPWRVAFALQANGWVLRSEIIWNKPNPVPESVRDRPTKAHEQVLLFSKAKWVGLQMSNQQAADLLYRLWPFLIVKQRQASLGIYLQKVIGESGRERRTKIGRLRGRARGEEYTEELVRIWATMKQLNHFGNPDLAWLPKPECGCWNSTAYFYNSDAIAEPASYAMQAQMEQGYNGAGTKDYAASGAQNPSDVKRRIIENAKRKSWNSSEFHTGKTGIHQLGRSSKFAGKTEDFTVREAFWAFVPTRNKRSVWTVPTQCYKEAHFATYPEKLISPCILAGSRPGDTILDPFGGSGTTGMVALELGRKAILIELNPAYVKLIEHRCNVTQGLGL